jgi:hypothetical protein
MVLGHIRARDQGGHFSGRSWDAFFYVLTAGKVGTFHAYPFFNIEGLGNRKILAKTYQFPRRFSFVRYPYRGN